MAEPQIFYGVEGGVESRELGDGILGGGGRIYFEVTNALVAFAAAVPIVGGVGLVCFWQANGGEGRGRGYEGWVIGKG